MPLDGPVVLLHGGAGSSLRVATRLAGDLGREGAAVVSPGVGGEAVISVAATCGALIVMHGSGVQWPEDIGAVLAAVRARGTPVLVCRSDDTRLPSPLHGFGVLSLVPGKSYQPTATDDVGYRLVLALAGRRAPRAGQKTAVFVSYARPDASFTDNVVGLLRSEGLTSFDYQFTERLDAGDLRSELARWVAASGVVLVVATPSWQASPWCGLERDLVHDLGKPLVGVWPPGVGARRAPPLGRGVAVVSYGRDPARAGRRLVATIRSHLPYPDG